MNMVPVRVEDLIGPALNWAVRVAALDLLHNLALGWIDLPGGTLFGVKKFEPSAVWAQGGPILALALSKYGPFCDGLWFHGGFHKCCLINGGPVFAHHEPLVAVCRAFVAAERGDVVEVPAELIEVES